jgi:heme O synthase-like polyprenyltransferase
MPEALGPMYVGLALVTSGGFMALVVRFAAQRARAAARLAFIGSVIHLPLLLVAMVAEAIVRGML